MKVRNPEYSVYLKKDKYIKDFRDSVSKQVQNQIALKQLDENGQPLGRRISLSECNKKILKQDIYSKLNAAITASYKREIKNNEV